MHQKRQIDRNTFLKYMKNISLRRSFAKPLGVFALMLLSAILFSHPAFAQGDAAALKAKAKALMSEDRLIEALPVLEQLVAASPNDGEAFENLGFALLGKTVHVESAADRKQLRVRARDAFVKAKSLGNNSNLVSAMISSLPEDGSDAKDFSKDPISNALTNAGERSFTSGKLDEAIEYYRQALKADPKNYFAALFAGDMYLKKDDFTNAETWYQKAIAIDPYIETAYRYSATPLMKAQKYDLARDRYIEAWITEPYSQFAVNGIIQWGQVTNTRLGHPKFDIPQSTTGADGKTNTTLNINILNDDGGIAWISYTATRETWKKEKFKQTFPGESVYRHSMAEEADALRSVVKIAKTLKSKKPNPQFEMIEKMDKDGVLEAYVLMAIPDQGIAKDHPAYLRANRDKLRLYVQKYVIAADTK